LTAEDLSVEDALQKVLASVSVLSPEQVPLPDALNRILADDVVSRDSLPPFANSSMDGYAVRSADVVAAAADRPVTLRVLADIAAGAVSDVALVEGTAARIMTGAPMPEGADAVVPVEETSEPWRDSDRPLPEIIQILRTTSAGDYVRLPGEDILSGTTVLAAGHLVRPQDIGVLASLGYARLRVVRRPRVGLLATGDELISVEEPLRPGKIRNSNSYAQAAQVLKASAIPVLLGTAGDSKREVRSRLQDALELSVDLIVSSAGVSVGAYDVVKAVLEEEGLVGFWRVRMRPGKPLAHGEYGGTPFLGLPGNPVSAMVSFERFARPAILKMAGHKDLARPVIEVVIEEEIHSDGRESYLRAIVERRNNVYRARTTGSQGSHIMTSLVKANALIVVPEGVKYVPIGERLQAMMIDWPGGVF
jgi:molybdopterin molybdotransferase